MCLGAASHKPREPGLVIEPRGLRKSPVSGGTCVLINRPGVGQGNITILNGHIAGGVTYTPPNTYAGPGFANGILYSDVGLPNLHVSRVSVSGCFANGINLGKDETSTTLVESCTIGAIGFNGIVADGVTHCLVSACGGREIDAQNVSDSTAQVTGAAEGINAVNVTNCRGYGVHGSAIHAANALNCTGVSTEGGEGILVQTGNMGDESLRIYR